ncbi:MAG TPA: hypothetical protein VFH70_03095 [Acidimicrobiales bacterium]|nr:hypothetical protein [Acidimicrobiales bacterium]
MSYDLVFWKQDPPQSKDPAVTFTALAEGRRPDGVMDFPIQRFLDGIEDAFPGAVREPNGSEEWLTWTSSNEQESFQVEWSETHAQVPLFDPQTGERFDSWLT